MAQNSQGGFIRKLKKINKNKPGVFGTISCIPQKNQLPMKKVLLTIAILGGFGIAASAQTDSTKVQQNVTTTEKLQATPEKEEFATIEITEIPENITSSITKQFPEGSIQSATKNEKGDYKITIVAEGKEQVLVIRNKN